MTTVIVVALVGLTTTLMQGRRAADEADRARLATAFVSELFRVNATQAAPQTIGPVSVGPAAFVDRGAELIETRFAGQPELQAELYGAVGRVYVDLGVDRLASQYAMRQLTSLRAQKASGPRIARSLMLLAEAALAASRDIDAEDFARQALDALPKNDAMAPDAFALLARAQARTGKHDEAKLSVANGKRALATQGRTRSLAGATFTWTEGFAFSRQNRFDEARPLFDAAIAEAIEVEGPNSRTAADMRVRLAYQLIGRGHSDEGRQIWAAAIAALEAADGVGRVEAALSRAELQVMLFMFRSASYEETNAVLSKDATFLHSQASVIPPELLAYFDFARAKAYVYRGEHALAKPLLDASSPLLLNSTQSLAMQWEVGTALGFNSMSLGDHAAADRFFRQMFEARVKRGRGSLPFAANDWAFIALNLSMQGRHSEAQAFLLKAPTFNAMQGDPSGADYVDTIPETLARVRLNAGDTLGAQQALPSTKRPQYEDHWVLRSYFQVRGEIRCVSGEHKEGLADLMRSIESQSAISGPNDPWIARLRAVAGLCALWVGSRKQAEALAVEARRAFVAQPGVSPYFKEPLYRLEQLLRPKAI